LITPLSDEFLNQLQRFMEHSLILTTDILSREFDGSKENPQSAFSRGGGHRSVFPSFYALHTVSTRPPYCDDCDLAASFFPSSVDRSC
jgi:hypothetical protein